MQYFEWYLPPGVLWKQLKEHAGQLAQDGITAVWIPPSYKGSAGADDVGYGVYDLYDLGEFDQKGSVPTKYGTKDELVWGIRALHEQGIQVYADIVLDHKMGADEPEMVKAKEVNPENRNEDESGRLEIEAWTHFTFPGRKGAYSDFEWHWYHFKGIDWDEKTDTNGIFRFRGKRWENVDRENGNFDYLMGADIDLNNEEVIYELTRWGKWFVHLTDVDGFRFDAIKHMKFTFLSNWLEILRHDEKEELFSVGEYWSGDLADLKHYVDTTEGTFSLFDVPLHYRFFDAANAGGAYDMRTIFDNTFTKDNPLKSVTFVDNHDTQHGQSLESWIQDWFKPIAYAIILLRADGYPCVFYGDYYGIPHDNVPPGRDWLLPLMRARVECAYGVQHDYFDHPNIVGWTREGDDEHTGSGLAVLVTNGEGGNKTMYVGKQHAGKVFYDCTLNREETVTIGEDGNANFFVNGGSASVWRVR
ncbi:alpha-amylase [Christensenellaceae bacterium OttesenSCG-928-K19]|nr:alpha-amylase [Christensenellaceae bacterium OttesenSCG-928-K19]